MTVTSSQPAAYTMLRLKDRMRITWIMSVVCHRYHILRCVCVCVCVLCCVVLCCVVLCLCACVRACVSARTHACESCLHAHKAELSVSPPESKRQVNAKHILLFTKLS